MESVIEILIWALITVVIFYVVNSFFFIRTAATLVISLLISSIFIYFYYRSLFGEIVLFFSFFIAIIYAIFRAIRDKRSDCQIACENGNGNANVNRKAEPEST
jgi:hypothetical protein